MADITNPEAVRFCNEQIRQLADLATRYYYAAQGMLNEWDATNMGSKITNTSDTVVDGSATDGRSPITGAMVNNLRSHVVTMTDDLDANSKLKLGVLLKIEVNGRT